jgi:hypothetical protein
MAETKKKALNPEQNRIAKLKAEPRVKVLGMESFQNQLGEVYTFLYNGMPVTIKFDGTYQEYPESVAKLLESKLSEIARANVRRNTNVKIG